jgi:DNA-binding transcriptional LysR family regulator
MLTTNELQVFLAAADTENFSEAGRRLGVSQPAISMQIKALEDRLGLQLFTRSGRHISLSEAGRALIPMARETIERVIGIEETMLSLQGEVVGLLKLTCSTTAGKYILPALLSGLMAKHAQVEIVCQVTQRELALEALRRGEAHIALTSLRIPFKDVEYRPFVTDSIVLVVPPEHRWANLEEAVLPEDLLKEPFIIRESTSGTLDALRHGLERHDLSLDHLSTVMTLGSAEAIRMAVQEGIGIAFVSAMVALEAVVAGKVAVVEVKGLDLEKTLYMARDTDRPATRAQTAFWDWAFDPATEHIRRRPTLRRSEVPPA